MSLLDETYTAMADVNLWLKLQTGDNLKLSDVPSIVPLRWDFFKQQWPFIKQNIIDGSSDYIDPDFLKQQVDDFSKFIESQRNVKASTNPLSGGDVFHTYYSIFDSIDIDIVNLSNEENDVLEALKARVNAFSKNDFVVRKNTIKDYRDRLVDIYGLNDTDYNNAYNRSSISAQSTATIPNLNEISIYHNFLNTIDFILSNLFAVDSAFDPFALAKANANNPEINVGQYASGQLVRLQFGESLQDLAQRYLGDRDKWLDIALANGLKPPFIDEIGERLSLISNATGNQINIAAIDLDGHLNIEKFYVNQPVFLKSNVEIFSDQRSIVSIKEIPISGEIILELDGESDLDKYKSADSAYIRIYKSSTTNSKFYTLIPNQSTLDNPRQEETPWFLSKNASDEKNTKIDINLNTSGDLSFSSNGDLFLSYGLDNAIQAIKLKMVTELGSLKQHPEYGLVNVLGLNNADTNDIRDLLSSSIRDQVESDPRFDRLESISVDYIVGTTNNSPSGFSISIVARLAGSSTVVPISFSVDYR